MTSVSKIEYSGDVYELEDTQARADAAAALAAAESGGKSWNLSSAFSVSTKNGFEGGQITVRLSSSGIISANLSVDATFTVPSTASLDSLASIDFRATHANIQNAFPDDWEDIEKLLTRDTYSRGADDVYAEQHPNAIFLAHIRGNITPNLTAAGGKVISISAVWRAPVVFQGGTFYGNSLSASFVSVL